VNEAPIDTSTQSSHSAPRDGAGGRPGGLEYKRHIVYERYKAVPLPLHLYLLEVFTASLARIPPFSFP
jgi:hypothetical protein